MSNDYQSLDTDRLKQIFKERITKPECPFCGHDDWALPHVTGSTGVRIPWAFGQNFALSGPAAVMLYCKNCGFMRLHALAALDGVLVEPDVIEVGPPKEAP
ncbi:MULTISPECIES: hypothetical protein [Pseudomonas]|uniref:hypothetical protein n=1 Tax=Pseudomonas TaxID=286 RepID=UPI001472CAAB|nr:MULTISPECIES: hypothetical protein [Pseudomonas]MCU0211639.1 hypothetical protein [Pseudomonas shahriarae]NMY23105.1 hypothetical protein [Pseudomonas sp. WS 5410]QYM67296.1 hypothetical protein K1X80_20070 [Pseudomonas sp. So3.2b]